MRYARCDPDTGRVLSMLSIPTDALLERARARERADGLVLVAVDRNATPDGLFYRGGGVHPRRAMCVHITPRDTHVEVTGIPVPARLRCGGHDIHTDDPSVALIFDEPGRYTLRIDAGVEWLPYEEEIEAP